MDDKPFRLILTDYISSLKERTRLEKGIIETGLDWIIYQLGMAKKWTPFRLPFFRQPGDKTGKTKTEAEFGEDISFLTSQREYYIFVLKDEPLTYKNWTRYNFDEDLRRAATPNLTLDNLRGIRFVKVILTYNADEARTGVEQYTRLTESLGTKIGEDVSLSFERWNLSKIVEEVGAHLFVPELLPQHLAVQFRYICSQVKDFDYGSKEWETQLIMNWRNFLRVVLEEPVDERKLRLIPVSLMILNNYRKDSPNFYAGRLDMAEWAMLCIWECFPKLGSDKKGRALKAIIPEIWFKSYILELERYFILVEKTLTTQHGFLSNRGGMGLGVSTINDAYLAYWHIGRLGILTLAPQEFAPKEKGDEFIEELVERSAEWLVKCLHMNPAALRPVVDLNHIELFLIWLAFWQVGRQKDIYEWLCALEGRLLVRRVKRHFSVPFIESQSRLDLVAEYVAKGERPYEYSDSSSYLLLMLMELCFSLPDKQRDELINRYMKRVVKGLGNDGQKMVDEEIDLMSWVPPDDWSDRILKETVTDGIAVTTGNFDRAGNVETNYAERIKGLVFEMRNKFPCKINLEIPLTVYILACIKNKSPLPPDFWRATIFPEDEKQETIKKEGKKVVKKKVTKKKTKKNAKKKVRKKAKKKKK